MKTALGLYRNYQRMGNAKNFRFPELRIQVIRLFIVLFITNSSLIVGAQSWSNTGSMSKERYYHTATLLNDGDILVAGGASNTESELASCELYDSSAGTWSSTGSLNVARVGHTTTLLSNGKVLVAGGSSSGTCEIYDPSSGSWSTTGSLSVARFLHTATLLSNGKVLIAGGMDPSWNVLNNCEIYDPSTGSWSTVSAMSDNRYYHTAILLSNGKVLITGGYNDYASTPALSTCELFDPSTGNWSSTGSFMERRYLHATTLLSNGKVLVTGGLNDYGSLKSCELYDPSSGDWDSAATMNYERYSHTATRVSNGTVVAIGGYLQECERYDPSSNSWNSIASMSEYRAYHTTTLLPDGTLIVAGGLYSDIYSSCEKFKTSSCLDPTMATLSASSSTNCGPVNTTLSVVSGSLNQATSWKWYSGSCGGTPVDSGSSITVSPLVTTTYYVRGEGACVTPGNCSSITITVFPLPDCTISGDSVVSVSSTSNKFTGIGYIYNLNWSVSGNATIQGYYGSSVLVKAGVHHNQSFNLTLMVEDDNGCTSTCVKSVNVIDNIKPTWIKAPIDKTVECDGNGNTGDLNVWLSGFTGQDASGTPTVTHNFSSLSDLCGSTGSAIVTFTLTDINGNFITKDATFTVKDHTPPVITCPGNRTLHYEANTSSSELGSATAFDVCGTVNISSSDYSTRSSDPNHVNYRNYSITRTWHAEDACGNSSQCYQIINLIDGTLPTAHIGVDSGFRTLYPSPYNNSYMSAKHQFLIRASELSEVGVKPNDAIKSLAFNVRVPGTSTLNNFSIRIGKTDSSGLGNYKFLTGLTQVYDSNYKDVKGWNEHVFSTPFTWDGSSNLVIETCFNNSNYTNNNSQIYCSNTAFASSLTHYQDYGNSCSATSGYNIGNTTRPTMRFELERTSGKVEALCKQATVQLGSDGTVTISAQDVDAGSSSTAGISSMTVSPATFNCQNIGTNAVTLTVTDKNNTVATCSTTVTVEGVVPTCTIDVTPSENTFTGGDSKTIFLGYGAQSSTLTANATGGSGFSYSWSPATYLSSSTAKNPVFSPTSAGSYTFTVTITNNNGCKTQCSVTLCVKDILASGAMNSNKRKVYLCHLPPGNPSNPQTLSISINAVEAHLSEHEGDALGKCGSTCGFDKNSDVDELILDAEDLEITGSPNPFNDVFTLNYFSAYKNEAIISIYGVAGNLMEQITRTGYSNQIELGSGLPAGIYTISFIQGDLVKAFKMIKVN